jgi:hypothetical protein
VAIAPAFTRGDNGFPALQLKRHHRVEWQTGRAGADFLTNRLRSDEFDHQGQRNALEIDSMGKA